MQLFNHKFDLPGRAAKKGVLPGWRRVRVREFFPHFTPPLVTCGFVLEGGPKAPYGLLTVEECGVEWGAVE